MPPTHVISGLAEVADRYDALLCDIWGVVHDGVAAFAPACEALARFRRERGPVLLLSNSPRPAPEVDDQLRGLGAPDEAWSALVTSGDATRRELAARAPGPALAIGPERDAPLYDGTGVAFVETPGEAAFVSCTGLVDDETETPEDYRQRLQACVARGLAMICANPDRVVQRGDRMIPCAGALADLYAELGGEVVMAGKPHPPIYALAYAELARLARRPLDRARILAIGDGLRTDVAGANAQALPLLFVADGIHSGEALGPDGGLDAKRIAALLATEGGRADYAIPALRW